MADPVQPSPRAVSAARYLRMMGVTRRRPRPQHTPTDADPMPPAPQVDPDDVADERSFHDAMTGNYPAEGSHVIEVPEVEIEGDPDALVEGVRDAMSESAGDAYRHRYGIRELRDGEHAFVDREHATPLTATMRGLGQAVSLDHMDEILGGLDTAGEAITGDVDLSDIPEAYRENQQRWQQHYANAEEDQPEFYNFGRVLGIGGTLASPAGPVGQWIGRAPTVLGRIGRSALVGGTMGAAAGEGSSPDPLTSPETIDRAVRGGVTGTVLGGGLATVGEGVRYVGNALRDRAPAIAQSLEPTAAQLRVRSAGARTAGQQRIVDDLPGGAVQVAQDLDRLGIARRGELGLTPSEAGNRAAGALAGAQSRLRAVFERMRQVTNGRTPTVDMSGVADELDGIANQLDFPGAEAQSDAAMQLASEIRQNGSIDFDTAQRMKRFYDSLINWNAAANPSSRLSPLASQRMAIRGSVRDAMDSAVGEVDPALVPQYQQARHDYQIANTFDDLAHDSDLRDAANRYLSPADTAVGVGGYVRDGVQGFALSLLSKLFRQREHSIPAGLMERTIDGLRAIAARDPIAATEASGLAETLARNPRGLGAALAAVESRSPEALRAIERGLRGLFGDAPPVPAAAVVPLDPEQQREVDELNSRYGLGGGDGAGAQDDEDDEEALSRRYGL